MKIAKNYKIPYISRMIPKDTEIEVIGGFPKEKGMIKVKIIRVPKVKLEHPIVESEDVYGIKEELLTI